MNRALGLSNWVGAVAIWGVLVSVGFAQESADSAPASPAKLRVELAQANLELAQVELKLAEDFNREVEAVLLNNVPAKDREGHIRMRSVPDVILERLRSNVDIARQQLDQAMMPSTGDVEKLRKKYADEKIRLAVVNLTTLQRFRDKGLPVKDNELKRQEIRVRLAKLNRQLLDSPENLLEIIDSLQRQVDHLHEDLIRQDQRITALEEGDK